MIINRLALVLLCGFALSTADGFAAEYVDMPGGSFASVLPDAADASRDRVIAPPPVVVNAFRLRTEPVTNAEFLRFVSAHPEWRRDRIARLFAEERYLSNWQSVDVLGDNVQPEQPVVQVSWFAAQAYCESEGSRLPTWHEWEYAAAADETRSDARDDPAWRERILGWYSKPSNVPLDSIGGPPNVFGVRDLHGLIWEWVDDAGALLVASDSRDQNDPGKQEFCGAGALELKDRNNYAILMRIALLSSLKASDTTANLGFRCVQPATMKVKP